MQVTFNATKNLQVTRTGDNELLIETTLLTTDMEAAGWITTDIKGLIIKDCRYAIYRTTQGETGVFKVPDLIGVEAYLNAGADLKRVLGGVGMEIAYDLISECVRGAVQGETFFYQERGFASPDDYEAYWETLYADSCLYYSNVEQHPDQTWLEYVGDVQRSHNLFNRSKNVTLRQVDEGRVINAYYIDTFHELGLKLSLDVQGRVTEAIGNFLRAPHKKCWENSVLPEKFIGGHLSSMQKRDIAILAGGSQGCSHMVDLIYEAAKAAGR